MAAASEAAASAVAEREIDEAAGDAALTSAVVGVLGDVHGGAAPVVVVCRGALEQRAVADRDTADVKSRAWLGYRGRPEAHGPSTFDG